MLGELIKDYQERLVSPIIIFESTVYPGLTEEFCIPILEKKSKKSIMKKTIKTLFMCGYSPERINPGDTKHNVDSINKSHKWMQ